MTELGLAYGVVALAPHSPAWAEAFRLERDRLARALAGLVYEIEHVGSTAVPGLVAKPIVDVAIRVELAGECPPAPRAGAPLSTFVRAICGAGYLYRGDLGSSGGQLFVRETRPWFRTHHVHLVDVRDPQWERYLRFRDLLRESAGARETYARRKLELARAHPEDRRAYAAGKDAVVDALLAGGG